MPSDGGFNSPRLHQIIYHLLIKSILSAGGFIFAQKPSNKAVPAILEERLLTFTEVYFSGHKR
jgi:hypothetical protein